MSTKRMGGKTLRGFSGIEATTEPVSPESRKSDKPKAVPQQTEDKLVTVNIKIFRSQHEWLNDTARAVRDNNDEPVPPSDRVYPQHLIQVAIELLKSADVDWQEVRSVEDLKELLKL